ncbi:beta-arrestin-1-like [Diadema antillarum]|uniref:beta-arrestin-1-like n=1 Tax=Diadema antillarum TaxID=105358 RepID=UPI003A8BFC07
MSASKGKSGTRVFKKASPNGKITTYLGKRDYVDHMTHIDPIDGVVLIDPAYLRDDRKVFARLVAVFRYGREELDVLGLSFRKELFLAQRQLYPPLPENERPLTRLQISLQKKLGKNAIPFVFELTKNSPFSVCLQPAQNDDRKPCGVEYYLHTFIGDHINETPHKRRSVELTIRKIAYAPRQQGAQPSGQASKEFFRSKAPLHLEASLDKEIYHHGEAIAVNVHVSNQSSKVVKKMIITVFQLANIQLFETGSFKCEVDKYETTKEIDGMPIKPSQVLAKVFKVRPLLENNREKRGLAVDGKLKHEDTNLASSTQLREDVAKKEELGITVKYKVEVRLVAEIFGSDLTVELPFILSHSRPSTESDNTAQSSNGTSDQEVLDPNLIKFDTSGGEPMYTDEDLLFEDFQRMCVKGMVSQATET